MKKIPALIILWLSITILFAACSGRTEKEPVTLNLMFASTGKELEFLKEQVSNYEKAHPSIKVNVLDSSASPLNTIKNALLGDQPVDAMRMDYLWVPELEDLDLLYPLNDMTSESDLKDFNATMLHSVEFDGKLYGLPAVMDAPALLYNKRMLQEGGFSAPPQTMDELLAMGKKLTNKDHYGIYLFDYSYFALPYIWAFGGGTISDDRQIEITSAEAIEGIKFMLRLKQEKATQPGSDYSDGYNKMMKEFKEGRSAMIINGPWAVAELLSSSEFKDPSNLGVATIPKGPKGYASPTGGYALGMSKYSKHPKEAYELISYLSSAEMQIHQAKEVKTLPARTSAYQDPALAADPLIQGFKQQFDAAKSRPMIPESTVMFYDFTTHLGDILHGNQSVEEGVRQIEASWKTMLKLDR